MIIYYNAQNVLLIKINIYCITTIKIHVVIMSKNITLQQIRHVKNTGKKTAEWKIYGNAWKPEKIHQLNRIRMFESCVLCLQLHCFFSSSSRCFLKKQHNKREFVKEYCKISKCAVKAHQSFRSIWFHLWLEEFFFS